MASTQRAPKQWCLSKTESINSFENWKQNLVYTLSLDEKFAPFLIEGVKWLKKSKAQPLRGFVDDTADVPAASRLTAIQKVCSLELMLRQIANYCPIISRRTLVKNATSLEFIWQTIILPRKPLNKVCPLCKQVGRPETSHFLSECAYLPDGKSVASIENSQG